MWDEKQFFEDFVKETDKIKPDADFANRLKAQITEENLEKKERYDRRVKYMKSMVAVAAVLLLFVGIGRFGILGKGNPNLYTGKNYAGKENITPDQNNMEYLTEEQKQVISMLENQTIMVDDAYGSSIDKEKRSELLGLMKKVRKLEKESLEEDFWENGERYYCVGEETVTFTVVEGQYVKIEEVEFGLKE